MSINFLKRKSVEVEYVNYEDPGVEAGESYDRADELATSIEIPGYALESSPGEGQGIFDVMTETVYKKAARWVLLAGVVLMPLFFLPWTTGVLELNKQLLLMMVAGVGLVLWLLDVVMSGKLSWRFNPLDKGVVALAGAVALSAVFSVAKFKSVFGMTASFCDSLFSVVGIVLVYLLLVNSFDDKGKFLRYSFSAALAVAVVYGLLQMFGIYPFSIFRYFDISIFSFTESRAFNTLGSINVLGIMSAIVLPMLYANKPKSGMFNYVFRIGTLAALAVLIVINWWVLWVVAIAGMIAVVVLESINTKSRDIDISTPNQSPDENAKERAYLNFRLSRFLFPMTVMVLGIFLVIVNLDLVFVKSNLPVEIAPSYGLSGNVARGALQENFAFGYGPENFSLAFDKYGAGELRNSTLSGVKFFDSTSYVLNMAVHNGLAGLAALGFVLVLLGWSLVKNISKLRNVDTPSESIGVISSVIAGVVAMFFYPFNLALVFAFFVLLALLTLTLWDSRRTYNTEEKASLSLVSSLGFIGGLISALVGLYFVSLNYAADVKYASALKQGNAENALNDVVKAINWNDNDDRFYRISSQLALTLLSQELNAQPKRDDAERTARIRNYLSSAVALAQKATQVAPGESNNWSNLGSVYQSVMQLVNGADALAETAYLKASELRPGDPSFHNRIGSMYLIKADILRQQSNNQQAQAALLKAEDAFKKAVELSSNFGLAIYNLGSVYERQGKLNEAIRQLETIAPFNADQPGLAFELGLLYYRADKKDKAFEQLQRAIVLFSDYANARWYLALIYEEKGQLPSAIEQLERILSIEMNKDNDVVLKKLEELKAGRVSIPPGNVLDQQPL